MHTTTHATTPQTSPRLLLTVDEAADALSLSRSKLYDLIAHGHIRAIKIGRATRIPRLAIESFVDQQLSPEGAAA